jgi:hypothetical protein
MVSKIISRGQKLIQNLSRNIHISESLLAWRLNHNLRTHKALTNPKLETSHWACQFVYPDF